MKTTKTLILTALLGVAGVATSTAQVYSLNIVGYVNVTLPTGFEMIANPVNAATNTVEALFPNPPEGLAIYRFNGTGYDLNTFEFDAWGDPAMLLNPGEGFFINNPGASYVNTFVGEVLTGNLSNPVPLGYSIKGSLVPQAGDVETVLGWVPEEGDAIYKFNGAGYDLTTYEFGEWGGGTPPSIEVAEGFYVYSPSAKSFDRVFDPNTP